MSHLTQIANSVKTDKGTVTGAAHGYTLVYDMLLTHMRQLDRVNLLEMGLAVGGPELGGDINRSISGSPSVDLWLTYFKNAQMIGFDISNFFAIKHDRFRFVRGDSGKQSDLEQIIKLNQKFDVIIDDASHASYHQQLGLANLFKQLKPGGFYIIEDLDWQPDVYEASLPKVPTTSKLLVNFMRTGEIDSSIAIPHSVANELTKQIASVTLFDESTLRTNAHNYNHRFGIKLPQRVGWRDQDSLSRLINPYFWLFNARRLHQSLIGEEFAMQQSVKLAILQRTSL